MLVTRHRMIAVNKAAFFREMEQFVKIQTAALRMKMMVSQSQKTHVNVAHSSMVTISFQ